MQALIFLILLVCLSIFWLQNPQNIVLIFFGTPTPLQLSLATWILIFVATGAITSFFIQFLAIGGSPVKTNPRKQRSKTSRETEKATPPFKELDWDSQGDPEWEIETPPKTTSTPTYRPPEDIPPPLQDIPVPQTPPREPSIYSYTPPKAPEPQPEQPKKPKSETKDIYDANYRVITPPYSKGNKTDTQNENEEEDWI